MQILDFVSVSVFRTCLEFSQHPLMFISGYANQKTFSNFTVFKILMSWVLISAASNQLGQGFFAILFNCSFNAWQLQTPNKLIEIITGEARSFFTWRSAWEWIPLVGARPNANSNQKFKSHLCWDFSPQFTKNVVSTIPYND